MRWLRRYDQGRMDHVLASMGITRKPFDGPTVSTAGLVNDLVKDKLMGMGEDMVSQMPGSDFIAMANEIRSVLGLEYTQHSRGWSSRQRTKAIKEMKENAAIITTGTPMKLRREVKTSLDRPSNARGCSTSVGTLVWRTIWSRRI